MESFALLTWRVGGDTIEHRVSVRNGEVLLSEYYLQSLLPPSVKFNGLQAVILSEGQSSKVNLSPRWDHEGHEHYLIDMALSSTYFIMHSNDWVAISDSADSQQEEVDKILDSTPGCSKLTPMCLDLNSDVDDDVIEVSTPPVSNTARCLESLQQKPQSSVQSKDYINKKKSIIDLIEERGVAGRLKKLLALCGSSIKVNEIPTEYNGTICFELPPTHGQKRMQGMEQKYDGHLWTRPSQTNMAIECTVRLSYCLGTLQCHRITCPYYISEKKYNETFFHGHLDKQVSKGYPASDGKSKITCHYCQKVATCLAVCTCMIYYVLPLDSIMTRLLIHVGDHAHNVQPGIRRANLEKVRSLVSTVLAIEKGGPRKIQMLVARQMLFESLTKDDEVEATEVELNHFLENLMPLVQNKAFKGIVSQERAKQGQVVGDGYDNILLLQKRCVFPFFHGSRFPGQGGVNEKCFLFKMSTKGPASGVELVNRMRRKGAGDLQSAWVHFDHTHRIDGWATMSCSVYDPGMRALQVIAICECKEEDEDSQILFWRNLNAVMEHCGHDPPDFAGFMSDEASANWLAIRSVYNGGPQNIMEGRERSCLFHWEQSLQKHTKKLVHVEKQSSHIEMCEAWRLANTSEKAALHALALREWWSKNVVKDNIKALDRWLKWWEQRIAHWGGTQSFDTKSPWERAQIPSINLSESVHASWLAGEGGKRKLSLYDACVSDVLNAYIQCAKRLGFTTGRFIGSGPSMDSMMASARRRESQNPTFVANMLKSVVANSPMYEEPIMQGDKETVQRKKKERIGVPSSHQPGFVMEARQRKIRGRPRSLQFNETLNETVCVNDDDEQDEDSHGTHGMGTKNEESSANIQEEKVAREKWALRRMPPNCSRKCFGMEGMKNCCNVLKSRHVGLVAPCFWSERAYKDKTIAQWIWFCNNDVGHTQVVQKQVTFSPSVPNVWPIEIGTNISKEEYVSLKQGGFKLACFETPQRNVWSTTAERGSSSRRRKWRHGISKEAQKRLDLASCMVATFMEEKVESDLKHTVFRVLTEGCYDVHIKEEPSCTCPDFQKRESAHKAFLACKHMYYVYVHILGLEPKEHMVIHQPSLTTLDLAFVLRQTRKIHPIM